MKTEYISIGEMPVKLYLSERPQGAVIAVHGFGGSKESAAIGRLAERLCPRGLCVVAVELPMHGERGGSCEQLSPQNITKEIMAAEEYAQNRFGGDLYAFATSFGGMNMLMRIERGNPYKRIVLRVPAVNMAETLITICRGGNADFSLGNAVTEGFRFTIGREYVIPYCFYEGLKECSCLRYSEVWDSDRIMTIYSGRDELVSPADTEIFLSKNPAIKRLCIQQAGHRMSGAGQLDEALNAAEGFFFGE